MDMGENCPKTSPIAHYQGTMACESMVRPQRILMAEWLKDGA
jgi:hypothetical protein